ncbi:MAG TPA: DUF4870 domain-containing protein [Candidatus Nanoarchaeia archaeon]|nr:DUF4870 domain-containing protein [Candidatus Nanoarchaeia archaeon]
MAKKKTPNKSTSKKKDNTLGILSHVLALLVGFLGPLIIFLSTEDKEGKKHAKNALNWQFSLIIYFIVGVLLAFVYIGFFIVLVLGILNVIFCIIAAVRASEGIFWKYPLSIPFFKFKK